jgi:hypothetical protein
MIRTDLAVERMFGHHLWGSPFETIEDVVVAFGALQAQEYPVAKWSVGQRARDVDDSMVEAALSDGIVLRTHVLRPTWHFVSARDIRWIVSLSAPRVNALNAYVYRQTELDDELFTKSQKLIGDALAGGNHLTRTEIAGVLEQADILAEGLRLAYIIMRAELDALICSGLRRGKQHTYALLDERATQAEEIDREEALAELTRRYFTTRGPATLKDYIRWSSLTARDAREGLDMVKPTLEPEVLEGRTYWRAAGAPFGEQSSPKVDLIQGYDECIMSYSESRDALAPKESRTGTQVSPFTHAILLDGHLIGHWKRVPRRNSMGIATSLYRKLNRAEEAALAAAVEAFGRFLGVSTTVL